MVVRRLVAIGARAEVTVAREVVTVMAISVSTTMSPPPPNNGGGGGGKDAGKGKSAGQKAWNKRQKTGRGGGK